MLTLTPSAPYEPQISITPLTPLRSQSLSTETIQEVAGLNQLMEANIRARANHINEAVNFNQLMGFSNDDLTQSILDDYLMTAMEMNDPHYDGVNLN